MKTECNCHDLPGDSCLAERPRYFPRQIITADDLTLEQEYFRNKLRRHNRLLHGWGVVCGALVRPVWKCQDKIIDPWKVIVHPGYILSPCGDEIIIDQPRKVNLRQPNAEEKPSDPCGEQIDPWCSEACPEQIVPPVIYLAVKYKERRTRPVRVQPIGCGCEDLPCEYSRFCDEYEFGLLDSCPESHTQMGAPSDWQARAQKFFESGNPDCPVCPESPWVVLARIGLDEQTGLITSIDNCACRRLVVSTAPFWWSCTCEMKIEPENPDQPDPQLQPGGTSNLTLTRSTGGAAFLAPVKVYAGPGISATVLSVTENTIQLQLVVANDVSPGPRRLIVTNGDCCTTFCDIEINASPPKLTAPAPKKVTKKSRRR